MYSLIKYYKQSPAKLKALLGLINVVCVQCGSFLLVEMISGILLFVSSLNLPAILDVLFSVEIVSFDVGRIIYKNFHELIHSSC